MQIRFNNANRATITVHQWDYGQTLEFESVPEDSEVHFPMPDTEDMAVVAVSESSCRIPNATLTMPNNMKAYLYQRDENSGTTIKTIVIRVIPRPQPEGYVYNPDDEEILNYNDLKDRIEAIVTAAENGEYDGTDGQDGASAYEIAVENGFVGTEQQWLASLKGETGAAGAKGDKGDKGDTGAYYHEYSTTEQVVGAWIDGKPLYEKTLTIETTARADQTYNFSDIGIPENTDFLNIKYHYIANNGEVGSVWRSDRMIYRVFANKTSKTLTVAVGGSQPPVPFTNYITIYYTKTSDTAAS